MSDDFTEQTVELEHQPVELYKILKFEGLADSGASAKMLIDEGFVSVNGQPETRRRRKIVDGDVITFQSYKLNVVCASDSDGDKA